MEAYMASKTSAKEAKKGDGEESGFENDEVSSYSLKTITKLITDLKQSTEAGFRDIAGILIRMGEVEKKCSELEETVEYNANIGRENAQEIDHLKKKIHELETENERTKESSLRNERHSRSFNLRFYGIKEKEKENALSTVREMVSEKFGVDPKTVENAYRIPEGPPKSSRTRAIIARFIYWSDRWAVLSTSRKIVNGTEIYVKEDLCDEDYRRKRSMIPTMQKIWQKTKISERATLH
ncbi:uncharacterized protein LOC100370677 isoform X1 [Saccoglossus kowalevskii]